MKTLQKFAEQNNLILVPITFKSQGITIKRKGYDLVKPNGMTVATFEPRSYSGMHAKQKWFITGNIRAQYVERITANLLSEINLSENSYRYNSAVLNKAI